MKLALIFSTSFALYGCAFQITLMPRDSGKVYTGEMVSSGSGGGTMTVKLDDGETCVGPVGRVSSKDSLGLANTHTAINRGNIVNVSTTTSSDVTIRAIMSCTSGKGLRCELSGQGGGGGICVDDSGRVFDALAIRK